MKTEFIKELLLGIQLECFIMFGKINIEVKSQKI